MEIVEQFPCEALDKVFKKLAEYADSKTLTKEEQEKYDNSMMACGTIMRYISMLWRKPIKKDTKKAIK